MRGLTDAEPTGALRWPRPGRRVRRRWIALAAVLAVVVVLGATLLWTGPVEWFSSFSVSPTVAYSGDINVTLSATVVGLSGPRAGFPVNFVTYPVVGGAPVVIRSAVTDSQGVATAHFKPEAPVTLRLFAQFRIPGTTKTVTSNAVVLQVYLPPTV
jgi:hypothetical protein